MVVESDFVQYCTNDLKRGFSLEDDCWLRVALIGENERYSHLVLTIHHALYDGWCIDSIVDDLFKLYKGGKPKNSPPFRTIVDYIHSKDPLELKNFWVEYLRNYTNRITLESTKSKLLLEPRTAVQIISSVSMKHMLESAAKEQITIAILVKAAWFLTLSIFTQEDDIVIGNVMSGRESPIVDIEQDHMFISSHSQVSLNQIQKWIGTGSQNGLFQTSLVFENTPNIQDSAENEMKIERIYSDQDNFNEFDIQILAKPMETYLEVSFEYSNRMDVSMIKNIAKYFDKCLKTIVQSIKTQKSNVVIQNILNECIYEREQLMAFGKGVKDLSSYIYAHQPFETFSQTHPKAIAVVENSKTITYEELEKQSNYFAYQLQEKGVVAGQFIALVTTRSIEMIIGIFAILKIGAAYVPIDSDLPIQRIQYILETANCNMVLFHPESFDLTYRKLNIKSYLKIERKSIDSNSSQNIKRLSITSSSPAYVIFTSGSTGNPKGVMVSHNSLVHFAASRNNFLNATVGSKVGQFSSINFDVSVGEIFCALSNGSSLYLRDKLDYFESLKL
ncbi:hypothetical protein HDV02_006046, partial [Globomyces sp. JEL0801]